jgi:hypothetical protein
MMPLTDPERRTGAKIDRRDQAMAPLGEPRVEDWDVIVAVNFQRLMHGCRANLQVFCRKGSCDTVPDRISASG